MEFLPIKNGYYFGHMMVIFSELESNELHFVIAGCCIGVLEVLPLSAAYGLDDLYQKCLEWVTRHFVRIWPSRAFASLPRELREKCYQQHVVHMSPEKVSFAGKQNGVRF